MPRFQSFSNSEVSFFIYSSIVEVERVIVTPSVSCNIRASFTHIFLHFECVSFSSLKNTFQPHQCIAPGTIGAGDFIHCIGLKQDDSTHKRLRSTGASPPAIRGRIKYHKSGYPLRPIVSCIGSALYNTSKFRTDILAPIYSVLNSCEFAKDVANMGILDDEIMVSFDIVSLFTATPVQLHPLCSQEPTSLSMTLSRCWNLLF